MEEQEEIGELNEQQKLFCLEYIKDFNGTQACIRAKYSEATASSAASRLLSFVKIKNYIEKLLDECSMSAKEITKRFEALAKANLSDYMTTVNEVVQVEEVISLERFILMKLDEVKIERRFLETFDLTPDERKKQQVEIRRLEKDIAKLRLEAEQNPAATRIVAKYENRATEVLDLAKLKADKEHGIIKSFKVGKNGRPEVELYNSDQALATLSKFKGMQIDKTDMELSAKEGAVIKIGFVD